MSEMKKTLAMKDEELVVLICQGESDLFGILIDRYQQALMRYVHYLIYNEELVDDIVQLAFIRAYQKLAGFDVEQTFSSWIYRIAHNEAISMMRREKRHLFYGLDVAAELADKTSLVDDLIVGERVNIVREAIAVLPDNYKLPLVLFYLEDKSYREIADILKISESNVGLRINRAKKSMKKILQNKKVLEGEI